MPIFYYHEWYIDIYTQTSVAITRSNMVNSVWMIAGIGAEYKTDGGPTKDMPYFALHYDDVIMGEIASQVTSLTIVYSTVYSDADQRKHQSSPSLAFVRGIHRDRWIPRTNGQLRGKCFHLMTSSWMGELRGVLGDVCKKIDRLITAPHFWNLNWYAAINGNFNENSLSNLSTQTLDNSSIICTYNLSARMAIYDFVLQLSPAKYLNSSISCARKVLGTFHVEYGEWIPYSKLYCRRPQDPIWGSSSPLGYGCHATLLTHGASNMYRTRKALFKDTPIIGVQQGKF